MSVSLCKGIFASKKNCNRYSVNNTQYCKSHDYFVNLSAGDIQRIRDGEGKTCGKCDKWHFDQTSSCSICIKKQQESRSLKKQQDNEDKGVVINKEVKKCEGIIGKNRSNCTRDAVDDTSFCVEHSYMTKYSNDELKDLNRCSTCRLYKYLGGRSTCGCSKVRRDALKDNGLTIKPPSITPVSTATPTPVVRTTTTVPISRSTTSSAPIDFEQYKLDVTNQINKLISEIKKQDTTIERLREDIRELKIAIKK